MKHPGAVRAYNWSIQLLIKKIEFICSREIKTDMRMQTKTKTSR